MFCRFTLPFSFTSSRWVPVDLFVGLAFCGAWLPLSPPAPHFPSHGALSLSPRRLAAPGLSMLPHVAPHLPFPLRPPDALGFSIGRPAFAFTTPLRPPGPARAAFFLPLVVSLHPTVHVRLFLPPGQEARPRRCVNVSFSAFASPVLNRQRPAGPFGSPFLWTAYGTLH